MAAGRLASSGPLSERVLAGYARTKLRTDGIYRELLTLIPPGSTVLDLGCGLGLLGLLLAARGFGDRTVGIEWDAAKVRFAEKRGTGAEGFQVRQGDFRVSDWPPCEVIVLLDVLHYFPPEEQRELLRRVGEHLPGGGRLLIRVMDAEAGGLARLTRFWERGAVRLGWNKAPRIHWRSAAEILAEAREDSLNLGIHSNGRALARGNLVLVGQKGAGALEPSPTL